MSLYEFAVYQMFVPTIAVFIFGMVYRISRYVLTYRRTPKPEWRKRPLHRRIYLIIDAFLHAIVAAARRSKVTLITGIAFLHFLGVIPLLFLYTHHVAWWSYYFPPYAALMPFSIPPSPTSSALTITAPVIPSSEMSFTFVDTIWGPLTIVLNADILAILAIVGTAFKLLEKFHEKLSERLQRVRIGDVVALLLLMGVLVSGYLATHHLPSAGLTTYRTVLGLHILLAEILVMTLPFTKFFHFAFSFWYGKLHEIYDIWRRGL